MFICSRCDKPLERVEVAVHANNGSPCVLGIGYKLDCPSDAGHVHKACLERSSKVRNNYIVKNAIAGNEGEVFSNRGDAEKYIEEMLMEDDWAIDDVEVIVGRQVEVSVQAKVRIEDGTE